MSVPSSKPVSMVTLRYLGSNPRTFGGRTVMGNKWSFDPTTQTTLTLREDEYQSFILEGYWEVVYPENDGHISGEVIEIPDELRPPPDEIEHTEETVDVAPLMETTPPLKRKKI